MDADTWFTAILALPLLATAVIAWRQGQAGRDVALMGVTGALFGVGAVATAVY